MTALRPSDVVSTGTLGGTRDVLLEPGQHLQVAIKDIEEINNHLALVLEAPATESRW
ncbi:hypothetical protein ABZ953_32985 [Streptomyces sp. NPDC046465]|uniref:fumarylacetoacetate hydrolase family protein n=1 Tax=Streptomyces sp. NPDC046465 TaxID=3155810 RepID=UPI003404D0C1